MDKKRFANYLISGMANCLELTTLRNKTDLDDQDAIRMLYLEQKIAMPKTGDKKLDFFSETVSITGAVGVYLSSILTNNVDNLKTILKMTEQERDILGY